MRVAHVFCPTVDKGPRPRQISHSIDQASMSNSACILLKGRHIDQVRVFDQLSQALRCAAFAMIPQQTFAMRRGWLRRQRKWLRLASSRADRTVRPRHRLVARIGRVEGETGNSAVERLPSKDSNPAQVLVTLIRVIVTYSSRKSMYVLHGTGTCGS